MGGYISYQWTLKRTGYIRITGERLTDKFGKVKVKFVILLFHLRPWRWLSLFVIFFPFYPKKKLPEQTSSLSLSLFLIVNFIMEIGSVAEFPFRLFDFPAWRILVQGEKGAGKEMRPHAPREKMDTVAIPWSFRECNHGNQQERTDQS